MRWHPRPDPAKADDLPPDPQRHQAAIAASMDMMHTPEDDDVTEPVIFGIGYKVAVGVGVGAAIGSVLGTGRWWERVMRGFSGAATSYVAHHVVAKMAIGLISIAMPQQYLPSVEEMEPVAALFIGLVGMVACQAAINAITGVADGAEDLAERFMRDRGPHDPA